MELARSSNYIQTYQSRHRFAIDFIIMFLVYIPRGVLNSSVQHSRSLSSQNFRTPEHEVERLISEKIHAAAKFLFTGPNSDPLHFGILL